MRRIPNLITATSAAGATQRPFAPADLILVSAGATRLVDHWLDGLTDGGQLILPLAPDVPERLIVGNERAFLTWFYERHATPGAIDTATVDEYLRTFSGREGVLGAMGIYRTAFDSIDQTRHCGVAPLTSGLPPASDISLHRTK